MPRPQPILFIEPSDDSRDMHADHLRTCGCTVLTTDTTDHGLSRASDADVIVTGIRVPASVDGVELVRSLRQTDRTKHTPVIVLLAAGAFESDQQRALPPDVTYFCRSTVRPGDSSVKCVRSERRP